MTATPTEPTTTPPVPAQGPPTPPKVDETDWKAEARKHEARAKEYKAAADELAAIKQASLSEKEKDAQRIASAEKDAAEARNESLRYRIAAEFKLNEKQSAALAHVSSEDGMRNVAEQLAASEIDRKKRGGYVPREGTNPTQTGGDDQVREFARNLFGAKD